jgi:Lar family restriction alleviation protein
MKQPKLKPCPFCGKRPTILYDNSGKFWEIVCLDSICVMTVETPYWNSEKEAIAVWNKRAK